MVCGGIEGTKQRGLVAGPHSRTHRGKRAHLHLLWPCRGSSLTQPHLPARKVHALVILECPSPCNGLRLALDHLAELNPCDQALPEHRGQKRDSGAPGNKRFAILLRKQKNNLYKKKSHFCGKHVRQEGQPGFWGARPYPPGLLGLLLLDEGVGDGLHAVLRADEHHGGAPAHHQAQLAGVLREFVLVVRVCREREGRSKNPRPCLEQDRV